MKRTETRRNIRDPKLVAIFFFIVWGHFGVKNGQRGRSALYGGENIRDQLFVCIFFDILVIMGDTERPRYTGSCGLSVRGIRALQCISI